MKHSLVRVIVIIAAMIGATSLGAWFIGERDAWIVQLTLVVGFILGFSFGRSTGIMVANETIQEVINERTERTRRG